MKTKLFTLLFVCLLTVSGADRENTPGLPAAPVSPVLPRLDQQEGMKLYRASLFTLAGAQAADIATSWGRHELNPFLTSGSPTARFGPRAVGLKSAFLSSSLVFQSFVIRRNPRLRRPFAIVNFVSAAALSAVALANSSR